MKRNQATLLLCAAVSFALPAQPRDFSIVSPATAQRGEGKLSVSLFDAEVNGLEAADLRVQFDPRVFVFSDALTGSATKDFSLVWRSLGRDSDGTWEQVAISLANLSSVPVNDIAASLLEVTLDVLENAPLGQTSFSFFSAPFSDYDVSPTSALLTVTAGTVGELGEPAGTLVLLASLLAGLTAVRCHGRKESGGGRLADGV